VTAPPAGVLVLRYLLFRSVRVPPGLLPWSGWLIIGGYAAFVVTLLAIA